MVTPSTVPSQMVDTGNVPRPRDHATGPDQVMLRLMGRYEPPLGAAGARPRPARPAPGGVGVCSELSASRHRGYQPSLKRLGRMCPIPPANAGVVVRDNQRDPHRVAPRVRHPGRRGSRSLDPLSSGSGSRNFQAATLGKNNGGPRGPKPGHSVFKSRSGRRGSNSRPLPWQGTALILYSGEVKNGL
jgi:hypothetical protein